MGSTSEVTNLGTSYTDIIYYGSVLFILVVSLNSLLHAEGDTKTYRNVLIISFFLNIILNPIFIFGFLFIPALGVKGIAVATLIAQFVAFIIIFIKIILNERIKEITKEFFSIKFYYLKNIFFQSMPITIAISGYSIAASIVYTFISFSGENAVAGYGAATRIEQVVLLPILGINTAIISIISQNFGAKHFDRVKETYFTSIKYGLFIMIISGILVYFISSIIPSFFSNDPEVIDYGTKYLKIAAFILPAYPIFFLSNGFFMALKKSENALINNLLRNVLVPILVFYLAKYLSADYNSFFWLWAIFQWSLSLFLLLFVIYFMKYRLEKSS